ncbi:MAG: hypothetical protein GY953_35045, partial [bacterium]|nr:hypothetical protein [bacterium]
MAHRRLPNLIAGLCCFAGVCLGEGRPAVKVSFEIDAPRYRDALGSFRGGLEAKILDYLIGNLNQRVRFLAFTSGEADYRLQLTLSRKQLGDPPPQGPTWEVGFMAKLDGPGLPGQSIYWQRFRPEARYLDRVGTHEELEPEIQAVADEADYSGLVRGLFREIVIASSGHFKADEQSR